MVFDLYLMQNCMKVPCVLKCWVAFSQNDKFLLPENICISGYGILFFNT